MLCRYLLRFSALGYLALLLVVPLGMVFYRAFEHGFDAAWDAITSPDAVHALWLTVLVALIAVPLNTIFGVCCALLIVRGHVRGKGILNALVDLPLALSPIVVGLSLLLLYGRTRLARPVARTTTGSRSSSPYQGFVLATIFVSMPFVVREVVPVLREIGTEQEQAASTLGASAAQIFRRVTLPAIRWGVVFGVVLTTARCLGEFGAVSVVSGHIGGKTETLTQYVQAQYDGFNVPGAYAASVVLALLSVVTLVAMTVFRRKEEI